MFLPNFLRFSIAFVTLASTAANALMAERITAENVAQLQQQGPDATGGIGDWFISNGVLCAVISDLDHEGEFSHRGGTLIDLGYCDRADDHYTSSQDLLNSPANPVDIDKLQFDRGENWVAVISESTTQGVKVTTRYALNESEPTQLSISKSVEIVDKEYYDFNFYMPFWFNYHSLEPFIFSSTDITQNKGFNNIDFVTRGSGSMRDAPHNADTLILPSPPDALQPIAYGWQIKSARRVDGDEFYELPHYLLADEESTAMMIMADSFYIGDGAKIGWLQLLQIPLLGLDEGERLEIEEVLMVGKRADVASITDQLFEEQPLISGVFEQIDSALHVDLPDGTPVTFVRAIAGGRFQFRLPAGEYRLRHRGSADRSAKQTLVVGNDNMDIGRLSLPDVATLELPRGEAMRLVFVGIDGTPAPDFDDRLTDFSVTEGDIKETREKVSQLFLAGIQSDLESVELPVGNYRVYATKGPEYSLSSVDITIKQGQRKKLDIAIPTQTVVTPGYISADLHVHSGLSFDNTFATDMRVRTFVAEHGEVMVSSEHDLPTNYAPMIEALGVQHKITSIPAMEMTSILAGTLNPFTGGHVNFFPFEPRPNEFRNGMLKHEDKRLRDILHDARERHPNVIAQLNHARRSLSLSGEIPSDYEDVITNGQYLEHMGVEGYPYNPSLPLEAEHNRSLIEVDPITGLRDIDFDAMEIVNPGGQHHQARLEALRKDWLSFLKQGHRISGTANSDSHHANEQVAVPRNMVSVSGDSIASFKQSELIGAIKAGNFYGTSGPMMELSLGGVSMGETFKGNNARLNIKLASADWIPMENLTVLFNGKVLNTIEIGQQREFNIEIEADQDAFIIVEVNGPASEGYAAVYPGITPYAFSNPIYIDFDSDGQWQAPGL